MVVVAVTCFVGGVERLVGGMGGFVGRAGVLAGEIAEGGVGSVAVMKHFAERVVAGYD